ncbi:MAG: DUF3299 domain-containing protein [Burkholderiaceae bacterium]|nr:DUF3299 domain-containing protein [Burkholderiaceae bacterium]
MASFIGRWSRAVFTVITCFSLVGIVACERQGTEDETARQYVETRWEELVPASWNPAKVFDGLNLNELSDYDPRAIKAMDAYREAMKNAPVNPAVQGKRIKLTGFVAPLDWESDTELKSFLLVPYFGACIHVPPPPSNQIVYVRLSKPAKNIRSMYLVTVYGSIVVEESTSDLGSASYSMEPDKVSLYDGKIPF